MTNTTAKKTYFNLHTDGLAFLNNVDFVNPKAPGAKQFLSLSVTLLEGDSEKPQKTYVSLVVPDALDEVSALLVKHRDAIANRNITVFANLKLAKLRYKPFVYGETSQRAGELGVNVSGNLIGMNFLRVGDNVVYERADVNQNASSATTVSTASEPRHSTQQPPVANTQVDKTTSTSNVSSLAFCNELKTAGVELFDYPLQITLSKDDAQFDARKEAVKAAGYRWNSDNYTWMKPEVELLENDALFEKKQQLLNNLGYRFDVNVNKWRVAFTRGGKQRQG